MEGPDPAGPAAGQETIRRIKEIHWECFPEGPDCPAAGYGRQRARKPESLPGSPAQGGVQPDGSGLQPETHLRRYVGLGIRI